MQMHIHTIHEYIESWQFTKTSWPDTENRHTDRRTDTATHQMHDGGAGRVRLCQQLGGRLSEAADLVGDGLHHSRRAEVTRPDSVGLACLQSI